MTRLIERWFPCKEVSENSTTGWGSGNTERALFTWFAARPTAQAKAAVICSLLPWPDEEAEQKRLQDLVKLAMTGRYAAWDELRAEILAANPDGASVLDPFSGRGIIPLEAARLGLESHALEYAPVGLLASHLLTDYPFRD
jgi:putative DNA methylase